MDNSFAYKISTRLNRHFMCVVVCGEGGGCDGVWGEGVRVYGVRV